jgi:hypothetical protein
LVETVERNHFLEPIDFVCAWRVSATATKLASTNSVNAECRVAWWAWIIANVAGLPATQIVRGVEMLDYTDLFQRERIHDGNPCILVEEPPWGDAEFYGKWLLAAAKAEAFWTDLYADQDFRKQIDRVCVCYIPDFGMAATAMIMRLKENLTILVLDVEVGEEFTMMAEMGFFAQKGPIYRMTLPSSLTSEKVRAAIFKYAKTEDGDFMLHPEYMVTTLPFSEATALQNRLRDGSQRALKRVFDWNEFHDLLFETFESCNHDHAQCRRILTGMGLSSAAIDAALLYLEEQGGYCDCEVLLNVGMRSV